MSAIAILEYGGANELFNQMTALAAKGRADYVLYYNEEKSSDPHDMDPMVPLPAPPHLPLPPSTPAFISKV